MFRYRRPLIKDLLLIAAMSSGWLLWFWLDNPKLVRAMGHGYNLIECVSWAIVSSFIALSMLYWMDYFRPFRLPKFIPDFITYLLVLPITAILTKPLLNALFHVQFIRYSDILLGAYWPAFAAAVIEYMGSLVLAKGSVKRTVYLALTDGEKEQFNNTITEGGWDRYYRILTQEEFNGALATGGQVNYIVISRIATKNFILHQNILRAQMLGVSILDYRTLLNQMRGHLSVHDTDLWTFLAGSLRQNPLRIFYRGLKFYFEPAVAGLMLLMLAPLFIIVGIVIKTTNPGPVFFYQRRTGYLGAEFQLVKFRSMRTDAESTGAKWASQNDNRVTPVGRFLRKTRIDELPQLWNVLLGEMSFIGPRPERPEFYEVILKQVPLFKLRLLVRPGITGWAQILGGYAASIEESERKLEYDLYYMQYLSPSMDFSIVTKTLRALVKGDSGR